MLGQALELELGADLTIGPALEEGFYYDCYLEERTLSEADKPRIESRIKEVRGVHANPTLINVFYVHSSCTITNAMNDVYIQRPKAILSSGGAFVFCIKPNRAPSNDSDIPRTGGQGQAGLPEGGG